jgi:hypothetical protein
MADVSATQDNFLGGRWSLYAQGRWRHPKYSTAMFECLNGLPLEEGTWTRRSGTWHMGTTRNGADGRLIDFDFNEPTPYKIELTNGHMRFWASTGLVYNATGIVSNVSNDSPAVITVVPALGTLAAGQQVQFLFNDTAPTNAPLLQGRTFVLVAAGSNDGTQWTLQDAISGAAVNAPIAWEASPGQIVMAQILDLVVPFYSSNWALDTTRFVQTGINPDGTVNGEGVLLANNQAPYIVECTQSQSLGPQFASFTATQADFIDGPYLDPVPTGLWGTATGIGNLGPVVIEPWNSTTAYVAGNIVSTPLTLVDSGYPVNYDGVTSVSVSVTEWVCLIANTNFNPQNYAWGTSISAANRYWAGLNNQGAWSSTAVYQAGDQVTYSTTVDGVTTTTLYTCITPTPGTNVNDNPSTDGGINWIVYNSATVDASGSGLGPGSVLFTIAFQEWNDSTSYNLGDVVSYDGTNYQSLVDGNYDNSPPSTGWAVATGIPGVNDGAGFLGTDVGRAIRLYSEPPPWVSTTSYTTGQNVQYPFGSQTYWTAQANNIGVQPGSNIADWLPATNASQWAWGRITQVQSATVVIVSLIGMSPFWTTQGALDTLLYTNPVYTWELGVYSNSTAWPSTGCWQGGRLWLSGALPNRIDSSVSNGIAGTQINFAPTNYDNTVGDSNGVSLVLNSNTINQVNWLFPYNGGVAVGTLHNEWLIVSSQLQDPITPSTAQANFASHFGTANVEPVAAPIALLFVQKLQRKIMELMQDVFTGRFRAPNLSVFAKDLSEPGIEEIRYQEEVAPLLWARMLDGSWAGCTYRRISQYVGGEQDLASEAAIVGWHRHQLGTGRINQSIMVGPNAGGTLDTLSMVTNQTTANAPDLNVRHVETLIDLFEENDPALSAWYLDDAIVPTSVLVSNTGLTLNGLWDFNGLTKTVWVGGLDCGDFLVTNGSVFVPWGSAGPYPAEGSLFTQAYFESLNYSYAEQASNVASVTVTPAGTNLNPATCQWYNDPTYGTPNNSICVPNWDAGVAYFYENTPNAIVEYNIADGTLITRQTASTIGITGTTLANSAACLGQDGYLYWTLQNGGIARINPANWELAYQTTSLGLTIEGMAPVPGPDGIQYIMLGINWGTNPGEMALFNGYTGALVSGATFTAPDGSNTYMSVGGPPVTNAGVAQTQFDFGHGPIPLGLIVPVGPGASGLPGTSPGIIYGTADNGTSPPTVGHIYKAIVGVGGDTAFETLEVLPSWFSVEYTHIVSNSNIIVDQTDNNLIGVWALINSNLGLNDNWCAKISQSGTLLWAVKLPSGNISLGQNCWNFTRCTGGLLALLVGQYACTINTQTGVLTSTNLGSANGQIGGGQCSDSLTGNNISFDDFSQGTSLVSMAPIGGTPSSFTFRWALMRIGNTFTGKIVTQTNYSAPIIVGSCFTSIGTTLRPGNPQEAGSPNGPPLGKTSRSHMFAALAANSMGASFASGATSLGPAATPYPVRYRYPNNTPYAPNVLYSGILWDVLQGDYAFDDMLSWSIVRPYPTTIASVTSFRHTEDR